MIHRPSFVWAIVGVGVGTSEGTRGAAAGSVEFEDHRRRFEPWIDRLRHAQELIRELGLDLRCATERHLAVHDVRCRPLIQRRPEEAQQLVLHIGEV